MKNSLVVSKYSFTFAVHKQIDMTHLFLPYELCIEMRDLGFTESCLATYRSGSLYSHLTGYESEGGWNEHYSAGNQDQWVSAVLWQQAFNWLLTHPKLYNNLGWDKLVLQMPDYRLFGVIVGKETSQNLLEIGKEPSIKSLIHMIKSSQ